VIAGEGGKDSALFAETLAGAYRIYAVNHGFRPEVCEAGPGKWSFIVPGAAFELFLNESGGHCVQRVPPTERAGRRHTSYVHVATTVLRREKVVTLRECDLQETFQRGSQGAGGQNANKVNSAVRLRHKPTGLEVFINGRDQIQNRATARQLLSAKLREHERAQQTRAAYGGAGRGDGKRRTYNLIDNRVTDHVTGAKCHRPEMVLEDGRFELLK
jgi:peptide chain release factor 1